LINIIDVVLEVLFSNTAGLRSEGSSDLIVEIRSIPTIQI